jgi:hypothetical protein
MVHDDDGYLEKDVVGMLNDVGALPEFPEFPPLTKLDVCNGGISDLPMTTIIQHNPGKRHARRVARVAKSRCVSKKQSTSAGAKKSMKPTSRVRTANHDSLINQVVAFSVSSELGKHIIMLLGGAWMESAISHGHIIGMVTRKSALKLPGCTEALYDVAWEYSEFGETAFTSPVLVGAVNAGSEIVDLRKQRSPARDIDECRGRPTLRQKRKDI